MPEITTPKIDLCDTPVTMSEPHEPPMGVNGGSLDLHMPDDIEQSEVVPTDPRPFKYVLRNEAYAAIAIVRVITEINNGNFSFRSFSVPEDMGCRLQLWLQQLKETHDPSVPFEYEDLKPDWQVEIKGGDFLMESDRELQGSTETFKINRRFGYRHPGFQRPFRIGQWRIVDSAGNTVHEENNPNKSPFEDREQDSFRLYISFHDRHPH